MSKGGQHHLPRAHRRGPRGPLHLLASGARRRQASLISRCPAVALPQEEKTNLRDQPQEATSPEKLLSHEGTELSSGCWECPGRDPSGLSKGLSAHCLRLLPSCHIL